MARFKPLGHAFVVLASLSLASCSVVLNENRIINPRTGKAADEAAIVKAAPVYTLTRHEVVAKDGVRLRGIYLQQPGARFTVLYFGGSAYTIGKYGTWTAHGFAPLGVNVFVADHRGYGQSEGTPTSATLAADGLALFDYLASLPDTKGHIIVHGHSMGSFIAGFVAASRPAAAVVLESSVTTAEEWAKLRMPAYVKPFVRMKVADELKGQGNLRVMPLIHEPLLIIVGAKDKMTPAKLSEELYVASPLSEDRKSIVVVPGAKHSDSMIHSETVAAYKKLLENLGKS